MEKEKTQLPESRYSEYFKPEIDAMDEQAEKNQKLYDEVHKAMEKNLERLDGKTMYGATSPYRDIANLGEVLNGIRTGQVTIIKEKANIKKTIIDLDIRKENSKTQQMDAGTNQALMRDILFNIQKEVPNVTKVSRREMSDSRGKESLKDLDPADLGINENDLNMIDKFRGSGN